jgi:Fuc2NAc and GlcNAc transferase
MLTKVQYFMADLPLYIFIILCSLFFTGVIRRYSAKNNLLDSPNSRSSHTIATPRGGGLSIVICFLVVIGFSNSLPRNIVFAFVGSGALIAAVGFWDDQGHIAARWRLSFHLLAALWVLFFLGAPPVFHVIGFSFDTGWLGVVVVAFFLVWLLNLFNFMDGIDGIAASETIFVACAGAYFSWLNGLESLSYISLVLAASTIGFLILNWPPAKIFMGDVGSGFLGLMFGIIAYANILEGGSVWVWVVLLGVFLVDSGITLLRRILSGDKWYEAHCSHAYQHAAKKWSHKRATIVSIIINLCWLLPLTYLVHLFEELAVLITCVAYLPLIYVALKFKSGMADS